MKALLALLAAPLGACAVVSVHTEGAPAKLSLWPLGVRVDASNATASSTSIRSVGLTAGCGNLTAGASSVDCDLIDTRVCSAALVHAPVPSPSILDRLAGATRAQCPNLKSKP